MYCGNDFGHAENDEPRPDLLGTKFVQKIPNDKRNWQWGDSITVQLTIANQGDQDAASVDGTIYISKDSTIDESDYRLSGVDIPPLAAGLTWSKEISLTLPQKPAEFEDEGVVYVGIMVDSSDALDESNEGNNSNLGISRDKLSLQLGSPPDYIYVLTHGFNPNALTDSGWSSFLSPWVSTFPNTLKELVQGSELEDELGVYSTVWNSSSGWIEAGASVIAGILAKALLPPLMGNLLASIAFSQVDDYMREAAANAEKAAVEALEDLVSDPTLLGSKENGQTIHLVGHSRGGAVNARLNQLLTRLGYQVDQYTALDGYSRDWPFLWGLLGDIPINTSTAVAQHRLNYRVQQPLFAAGGQLLDDALDRLASSLLGFEVETSVAETILGTADVRAPLRPGFKNVEITGTQSQGLSNHLNVHELYFESTCRSDQSSRYVLDSSLGRALVAANAPGVQCSGYFNGKDGEAATESYDATNVILQDSSVLGNFFDGGFEDAGSNLRSIQSLSSNLQFDNSFLNHWLRWVRSTDRLLASNWHLQGQTQLQVTENASYLKIGPALDSAVEQFLSIPSDAIEFIFDLTSTMAAPNLRAEIYFNDQLLQTLSLAQVYNNQRLTVSLASVRGKSGALGIRLAGLSENGVQLFVDNLQITAPLLVSELRSSVNTTDENATELSAKVVGNDATKVHFYRESNGVEGLQRGVGGDRHLATDSIGSDGWKLSLNLSSLAPGVHILYAIAQNNLDHFGMYASNRVFAASEGAWTNSDNPKDVNGDSLVSPLDALRILNDLNLRGTYALTDPPSLGSSYYPDVNEDAWVTPLDALLVINHLNLFGSGEGESKVDEPMLEIWQDEMVDWWNLDTTSLRRKAWYPAQVTRSPIKRV